jgi:hypothetical protein
MQFADKDGRAYYHHAERGTTQWSHPLDEFYRQVLACARAQMQASSDWIPYPATPAEISDMAEYLGFDLRIEPHLFYIARMAVEAPLATNWRIEQVCGILFSVSADRFHSIWLDCAFL